MKRIFAVMMCLAVMCGGAWGAYYDEGNDGDSWETAYVIDSVEDFMLMRKRGYSDNGKYLKLTADLNISSESFSTDDRVNYFMGHLDGGNHTVTVNIDIPDDPVSAALLFGTVSSDSVAIRNLNVAGNVRAGNGGLASSASGIIGNLYSGTVENCSFSGIVEAQGSAGGIAGTVSNQAVVKNCTFSGAINVSGDRAGAGGIAIAMNGGRVENCTVLRGTTITCNVRRENSGAIGGIACEVIVSSPHIINCTSYAVLEGSATYKGGIVGYSSFDIDANLSGNTWPDAYPQVGYEQYSDPSTPTTPTDPVAPSPSSPLSSHKYAVFNLGMTWAEAKAYCESLGGHLATITSQEEQDVVMSIIAQDEEHIYWLGADKNADSDEWKWVTEEAFTFTKWHDGEPNNQGDVEQCLELTNYWTTYSGQWGWNDENGDVVIDGITGFICEWEPVEANFAPLNPEYLKWRENPDAYFADGEFYGELPDPFDLSHLASNPARASGFDNAFYAADTLPAKYDPRNSGKLPAVRSQSPYGTCWAFASLGAMEANYLAQNLGTTAPDLSELHQAWFVYKDPRPGYSFPLNYPNKNILDQGGSLTNSQAFLSRAGTASETELPYSQAASVESRTRGKLPEEYSNPLRLKETFIVGSITASNRDEVKRLIMTHGALGIVYHHGSKGMSGNTYFYNGNDGGAHAVCIVGWDDNIDTTGGKGAWLARNSWGSSWGDGGYFWMSYAQNISNAAVFVADDKTQGLRSKGYDQLGKSDAITWHWSANVFRAEGDETIREVAFHTSDNNVSYEIYINKLGQTQPVNPGVPDKPVLSGTMPYAGYHSMSLNGTIDVKDGEYFSVIVKLTGSSAYEYYSAVEEPGTFTAAAVHIGESYFADTNGTPKLSDWADGTTVIDGNSSRPCNACIKVFTADTGTNPTPNPTPTPTPSPTPTPNPSPSPDTPGNNSSGGGGGGCSSAALPAMFGALALAFTFTRKK